MGIHKVQTVLVFLIAAATSSAFAQDLNCAKAKELFQKISTQVHAITLVGGMPQGSAVENSKMMRNFADNILFAFDSEHLVFLKSEADLLSAQLRKDATKDFINGANCTFLKPVFETYNQAILRYRKIVSYNDLSKTVSQSEIAALAQSMSVDDEANPELMRNRVTWPKNNAEILHRFKVAVAFKYAKLKDQFEGKAVSDETLLHTAYMHAVNVAETGALESGRLAIAPATVLNAMMKSLDPYSDFNLQPIEDMGRTVNMYLGLGFNGEWITYDGILILSLRGDGPAAKAGVQAGDYVTAVNGKSLRARTNDEVVRMLKCTSEKTEFSLQVHHANGKDEAISVGCRVIPFLNARSYEVSAIGISHGRKILLIRIHEFAENVFEDILSDVNQQVATGNIAGYIVDLRHNGGGSNMDSWDLSSMFLKGDLSLRMLRANGTPHGDLSEESTLHYDYGLNKPLVVLTDEFSASASEHMAGNLQDYNRAIIVSEREQTYGKGTSHRPFSADDVGVTLKTPASFTITNGFYYLPSGRSPQLDGIKPDFLVGHSPHSTIPLMRDLPNYLPRPAVFPSLVTQKWIADACFKGFIKTLDHSKIEHTISDMDLVESAGVRILMQWADSGYFRDADGRQCAEMVRASN
jgi:C-terminal peptidase prc